MIVCDIDLFSMNQKIFNADENGNSESLGSCSIENLPNILIQSCYNYNTNTIHLFGNKSFITELIPKIQEMNNTTYSNKLEINIEVN